MINLFHVNKLHSFVLFFFTLAFFAFNIKIEINSLNIICFFLIATIGVSHGSLDYLKGNQLLKKFNIKNKLLFYFVYIFLSLLVVVLWMIFPLITLIIFLIIASYHFGKEDSVFGIIKKKKLTNLLFFLKGSLVISAPLFFNFGETIKIFEALDVQIEMLNKNTLIIFIVLSLISNFFLGNHVFLFFVDSFTIILLNLTFGPLLAFTIYFCFLHSFRHSFTLIKEIDNVSLKNGLNVFIKKALPLTVLTSIIFLVTLFFLNRYYFLDIAILKVIFIGLASLTLPHILLEYIVEKNEK
jgi:Brp/Blh family beta-carotene 15,15'-monooxygenase